MVLMLTLGLVVFLMIGLPVSISLGLSALGAFLLSAPLELTILSQKVRVALQNYALLAIPLFILAAKLMTTAGISQRIFRFADTLVGFLRGGLGHANILGSLIFSGRPGAAVVDAAVLEQIELKAMTSSGYPPKFAAACTASSSIIGPIFPPSIPLVVFSFVSGVSVGRLFLRGVVPGLVMTAVLISWVAFQAKRHRYPRQPFPTIAPAAKSFAEAIIPLVTPVILIGGIWMGIFRRLRLPVLRPGMSRPSAYLRSGS
jgi:C4-dicarboxylate transporter DctM subunit